MSPPLSGVVQGAGVSAVALTLADITAVVADQLASGIAPSNIPVGGSPFTYQNTASHPGMVIVSGGIVTTISKSRDGVNYFLIGLLAGEFYLSVGDFLRVVYATPPTNMTFMPL